MPTIERPRRASTPRLTGFLGQVKEFLVVRNEEVEFKKRKEFLRDKLSAVVQEKGEQDEKGSFILDLPESITVGGKEYTSLKHERKVSQEFLEDEAEEWLQANGLLAEAQETVTTVVLDHDAIYRLNQEGKIPDDVLDSWFKDKVSWAFKPLT